MLFRNWAETADLNQCGAYNYGDNIKDLDCSALKPYVCEITIGKLSNHYFSNLQLDDTGSQGYKTFFILNSAEHEIYPAHNVKMPTLLAF